jgi:hypothetical protein
MTATTSTFDRVGNRIRKLFPVFRANHSHRRTAEGAKNQSTSIGPLTLNPPQKSLVDDICWDVIVTGLEATGTERRGSQEISKGRPFSTIDLPERHLEDDMCWEILLQDEFEPTPPFFVFASVRKPGSFTYSRHAEVQLIVESDKPKPIDVRPAFRFFSKLPFELRLKIWHLTIQPRIVHWNNVGAKRSYLRIDRQLPVILQVCHESRCEGLQIFDIDPKATRPFSFNPKSDTLLWTRYPNCPKTVDEDAERLLKSPILRKVRHITILLKYWNRLLSQEGPKELYTAIRNAPNLEVLTLVDDYFLRRTGYSQLTYGRVMRLLDIYPEENDVRTVRWEKELRIQGKKTLWKKWDVNLTDSEGETRWKFPQIKFARVVIEMP